MTSLSTDSDKSTTGTFAGKALIGLTGGVALGLMAICVPFIAPALRKICLPYIPATDVQMSNILKALEERTGMVLDLGSGDGRIVFETAKHKFVSHGVELNPWLVLYSKLTAFRNGISKNAQFFRRDLWKFNISNYDNIVIFGVEQMMTELEKKFLKECKQGCCIIACRFPLPNIVPDRTVGHGIDKVWIYTLERPE